GCADDLNLAGGPLPLDFLPVRAMVDRPFDPVFHHLRLCLFRFGGLLVLGRHARAQPQEDGPRGSNERRTHGNLLGHLTKRDELPGGTTRSCMPGRRSDYTSDLARSTSALARSQALATIRCQRETAGVRR